MELKYHEISCPPPLRVTALDFGFGRVATAISGADARQGAAEKAACATAIGGVGALRASLREGASGARSGEVGPPVSSPIITVTNDSMRRGWGRPQRTAICLVSLHARTARSRAGGGTASQSNEKLSSRVLLVFVDLVKKSYIPYFTLHLSIILLCTIANLHARYGASQIKIYNRDLNNGNGNHLSDLEVAPAHRAIPESHTTIYDTTRYESPRIVP